MESRRCGFCGEPFQPKRYSRQFCDRRCSAAFANLARTRHKKRPPKIRVVRSEVAFPKVRHYD